MESLKVENTTSRKELQPYSLYRRDTPKREDRSRRRENFIDECSGMGKMPFESGNCGRRPGTG
jgi:hypothetical protein